MPDVHISTMTELLADHRPKWLKFLTKPIATYNNTLIDHNEVRKHVHLTDSRTWTPLNPETNSLSLGTFSVLPLETIYDIFCQTTVQSLMYLRASNSAFKALVESWHPFQDAMARAQPVVRALIATQASKLWTFTDLAPEIYTKTCYLCGEHGEIIHLLKLRRVCFRCVTTDRRLLAVPAWYARDAMGLRDSDIEVLPRLSVIAQRSSWGRLQTSFGDAVDWTAAVSLALSRQNPTMLEKRPNVQIPPVSSLLLTPPESTNIQHSCCIHLPVLDSSTEGLPPRPVHALLCAGCSFYFNYHSSLPHQAHTLYPHDPTTTENIWTPIKMHLKTCRYAYVYFRAHIYPVHLLPHPGHPLLISNGGRYTPRNFQDVLEEHHYQIFFTDSPYRHFSRHRIDTSPGGGFRQVSASENNAHFEMIPLPLLDIVERVQRIPHQTGLELELTQKLEDADAEITAMLDPSEDHRFDIWTRNRLILLRRQHKKRARMATFQHSTDDSPSERPSTGFTIDTYGDALLASSETVSQAQWATAHKSSSMFLFGAWTTLLYERRSKQEAYEARKAGGKVTDPPNRKGKVQWGFDRFGCVSDLG